MLQKSKKLKTPFGRRSTGITIIFRGLWFYMAIYLVLITGFVGIVGKFILDPNATSEFLSIPWINSYWVKTFFVGCIGILKHPFISRDRKSIGEHPGLL
jgi:hypothetical protein